MWMQSVLNPRFEFEIIVLQNDSTSNIITIQPFGYVEN